MMKLIGIKRIITLGALLAANVLVGMVYLFVIEPMQLDAQMAMNRVNSEIGALQGKISGIKADTEFLQNNVSRYQSLQEAGFFRGQDRFKIGRLLEDMRKTYEIDSFSFTVADPEEKPHKAAADINHQLISSSIRIDKINTLFDRNVYAFIQGIPKSFPPYTRLISFEVVRNSEVTEAALKSLADKKNVSFLSATIVFDWMTLVSKEPETSEAEGAPGTFRER